MIEREKGRVVKVEMERGWRNRKGRAGEGMEERWMETDGEGEWKWRGDGEIGRGR